MSDKMRADPFPVIRITAVQILACSEWQARPGAFLSGGRMTKPIGLATAFAVGVIFPLLFFAFNDPDRVKFSAVVLWFYAFLI
jgi:hypothetical protein